MNLLNQYMNFSIAKYVTEPLFKIIIVLQTQGMNMDKEANLHNETNLKSISKYIWNFAAIQFGL